MSDAIRKGIASWAMDEETLITMRARGVRYIGVMIRDSAELYLTAIDRYFDNRKAKIGRNSARFLPLEHFKRRPGRVKL